MNSFHMVKVKIQEDIVIAREIVINDAEPSLRFRLTKRQTQEEVILMHHFVFYNIPLPFPEWGYSVEY